MLQPDRSQPQRKSVTGIRRVPVLARSLWALNRDPLQASVAHSHMNGDLARVKVGRTSEYMLVRGAEHARRVLITNQDNYRKPSDYEALGVVLGNGLLTVDDMDLWRRQRRLVQPMFAKRHLDPFAAHMIEAAGRSLGKWDDIPVGKTVDMSTEMNRLTLDVVGRALFGSDLSGPMAKTIGDGVTDMVRAAMASIRIWLPRLAHIVPGMTVEHAMRLRPLHWRAAQNAIKGFDDVVERMIAERRADAAHDKENLLSLLIDSRDEESGEAMSDRQVRDEILTFLLAGHETTANALSWMWMLLSQHPEARERLFEEVDGVLGGRTPTADDLDQLPYTAAVFQEAMRLYPPVWSLPRQAIEEDRLGDTKVHPGAIIVIFTYLIHRDPEIWPNPEGFDPQRFMPGAPERPRQAFMPFGAGRRVCVGAGFAMMEGVLLTAMIAQRFRLDLSPGERVTPEASITLRPKNGIRMTIAPRA
ncbi:MAG TPA: cytochrome P450 [Solirubrobacterales bacterium]|jgi:cytochrome P450|nr:cytochrome P450 [Solirubrobacterales bacterium]